MATALPLELFERLPKTDLHVHLDGSLRLDTLLDLARAQGVALPTRDRRELLRLFIAGEDCRSLDDYLAAFAITLSLMQTAAAVERVAVELAEDAWREDVRYLEVCPSSNARARRRASPSTRPATTSRAGSASRSTPTTGASPTRPSRESCGCATATSAGACGRSRTSSSPASRAPSCPTARRPTCSPPSPTSSRVSRSRPATRTPTDRRRRRSPAGVCRWAEERRSVADGSPC